MTIPAVDDKDLHQDEIEQRLVCNMTGEALDPSSRGETNFVREVIKRAQTLRDELADDRLHSSFVE